MTQPVRVESHTAPWFAVHSPTLTALGGERRLKNKDRIVSRAEKIMEPIDLRSRIDFCFALEEAASQLEAEGLLE